MQTSLFTSGDNFTLLDLPGAEVKLYPQVFNSDECAAYMSHLAHHYEWRSDQIVLFGKPVEQPRLVTWVADDGIKIRYSGITIDPQPFSPELLAIKAKVEQLAGCQFNSVLCNWYRHGQDSMAWHSDDEKELGPRNTIASVSLGATRKFQFKHKHDRNIGTTSLQLQGGSLLIMAGDTQKNYKHQVPKTTGHVGPRINLTFRLMHL